MKCICRHKGWLNQTRQTDLLLSMQLVVCFKPSGDRANTKNNKVEGTNRFCAVRFEVSLRREANAFCFPLNTYRVCQATSQENDFVWPNCQSVRLGGSVLNADTFSVKLIGRSCLRWAETGWETRLLTGKRKAESWCRAHRQPMGAEHSNRKKRLK